MMTFWMHWILPRAVYVPLQAEALEIAKDIADIQGMVRSKKKESDSKTALKGSPVPNGHDPRGLHPRKLLRHLLAQGGTDKQEEEPSRVFRVRSSDRAKRSYDIGYLSDLDTVGDLHFEYARVSRRGANGFCLVQEGIRLRGTWKLGTNRRKDGPHMMGRPLARRFRAR